MRVRHDMVPRLWPGESASGLTCGNLRREGFLVTPMTLQPSDDAISRYACSPGPFCDAKSLAVERDRPVAPSVLGLKAAQFPYAIVWRVTLFVVDAFHGMAMRSAAHISNKILKRKPSFTDRNASGAIVRIRRIVRAQAALLDSSPYRVFGCLASVASGPVRGYDVSAKASATTRTTQRESSAADHLFVPAVALAEPPDGVISKAFARSLNRHEAPEASTCYVDRVERFLGYSFFSHAASWFIGDGVVRGWLALVTPVSLVVDYPTLAGLGGAK
jgi:hypothetical protein